MVPPVLQSLDRYIVQRPLGAGAEASLWLAIDKRGGPLVALKCFAPAWETGRGGGLREISSALALPPADPNLVAPLDYGYLPDGSVYLIYEYAPGGTLREEMEQRKIFSEERALLVLEALINGLCALHGENLLHCDLKPENILRFPLTDGTVAYKLADFGMLTRCPPEHRGGGRMIAGSPAYMAPERFRDEFGPSSDLYSVGVIFYEMLAGQRPFAGGPVDLARAHGNQPPPPLTGLRPGVESLLVALLAKAPGQRPQNAWQAKEMLVRLGRGTPAEVKAPPLPARPPRLRPLEGLGERLVEIGRFALPHSGGGRAHVVEASGQPRLILEHPAHLTMFDARSGSHFHTFIPRETEPIQILSDGSILHYRDGAILRWHVARRTVSTLASVPVRPRNFAYHEERDYLAWATAKQIHIETPEGRLVRPNDFGVRDLVWEKEEAVLTAAGGPLAPTLHRWRIEGAFMEAGARALPGPVFDPPASGGREFWICLDPDSPTGVSARAWRRDGSEICIRIPEQMKASATLPEGLAVLAGPGLLSFWDSTGAPAGTRLLEGRPDGFSISPRQRFLLVWQQMERQTRYICYENRF